MVDRRAVERRLLAGRRLRFDVSHFSAVEPEQLAAVEASVNRHLLADPSVRVWYASQEEARKAGLVGSAGTPSCA